MSKTNLKLKYMQTAANKAVSCMKYVQGLLKPGITEISIAKKITNWFLSHNCEGNSFDPIVAFGKHSANPHHKPTNCKLKPNEHIVIDLGCVYKGYCSDITRTFFPPEQYLSLEMIDLYNLVYHANVLGIKNAKVGIKACNLDKKVRNFLSSHKVGQYFIHTLGHGIGKVVHEGFKLGKKDNTILKNGMFFTIEPGIYIKGWGGIRVEDTVTLLKNKVVVLTSKMPK